MQAPACPIPDNATPLFSFSTYLSLLTYSMIAGLLRLVAVSPLILLFVNPMGLSMKWLALLCPILLIAVIMPMRFSFARAAMSVTKGNPFSMIQAFRLSHYEKKLFASALHALRIFLWGIPLLLLLSWLYYMLVYVDAFSAVRILTKLGDAVVSFFSAAAGLFTGLFSDTTIQWQGGLNEGLYIIAAAFSVTVFLLLLGIWKNSAYRFFWAAGYAGTNGSNRQLDTMLHRAKGKHCLMAFRNLAMWIPSFVFGILIYGSLQAKLAVFLTTLLDDRIFAPISFTNGDLVLVGLGILCHLCFLPMRKRETVYFAGAVIHENQ